MSIPLNTPHLILELGRLQIFHHPSQDEIKNNTNPKEIYWQDTLLRNTYGPFSSIYEATRHYSWTMTAHKKQLEQDKLSKSAVIYVDFLNKKRISNEILEE